VLQEQMSKFDVRVREVNQTYDKLKDQLAHKKAKLAIQDRLL
jgi:hypothetical protein